MQKYQVSLQVPMSLSLEKQLPSGKKSLHVPLTGIPMRQEAYQPEETEPSLQTGFIL